MALKYPKSKIIVLNNQINLYLLFLVEICPKFGGWNGNWYIEKDFGRNGVS
jgi:hypothetical protein